MKIVENRLNPEKISASGGGLRRRLRRAFPRPNLSLQGSWRPLTLAKTMRTCRLTTHLPSPVSYLMFDLNINCAAVSAHLRELLTQSIRIQLAQ